MSGAEADHPTAWRHRLPTFSEAIAAPNGVVVLEADWGGQILVVARSPAIGCDKATLGQLLYDLAELTCPEDELQGIRLSFLYAPPETTVAGGVCVGDYESDVWVHPELIQAGLEDGVRDVIAGERARLPDPGPPVSARERERILRAYRERLPANGIHFGLGWPAGWSSVRVGEIERRMDAEIPPRADGERWYGGTLRAIVRQAGLKPWRREPRYRSSLAEAHAAGDSAVRLEAEWGGLCLVAAGASLLRCDEAALAKLLADLAELARPEDALQGTRLVFSSPRRPPEEVWVQPELAQAGLEPAIGAVLAGERDRIPEPDPPVTPAERERILRAYRERLPASGIHFGFGRPAGWSSLSPDEVKRRMDAEIPPRADGERWDGATLRAVVRRAGLSAWNPRRT